MKQVVVAKTGEQISDLKKRLRKMIDKIFPHDGLKLYGHSNSDKRVCVIIEVINLDEDLYESTNECTEKGV